VYRRGIISYAEEKKGISLTPWFRLERFKKKNVSFVCFYFIYMYLYSIVYILYIKINNINNNNNNKKKKEENNKKYNDEGNKK